MRIVINQGGFEFWASPEIVTLIFVAWIVTLFAYVMIALVAPDLLKDGE